MDQATPSTASANTLHCAFCGCWRRSMANDPVDRLLRRVLSPRNAGPSHGFFPGCLRPLQASASDMKGQPKATLATLLALVMLTSSVAALDDPRWRLFKAEDGTVFAISMTMALRCRWNKQGDELAVVMWCEWDTAIASCASKARQMLFDCRGRSLLEGQREPAWLPHEAGSVLSKVERVVCELPMQ